MKAIIALAAATTLALALATIAPSLVIALGASLILFGLLGVLVALADRR